VVVFDYFYTAPGLLAVDEGDIYDPVDVESEALPLPEDELRLDYAWVRLGERASGRVARINDKAPALVRGAALTVVSAGGGIPLKWDSGGRVRGTRTCATDYFTVDSDTLRGSSGGAAFDESLTLRGIMVRGERDWDYQRGCFTSHREDDPDAVGEEFLSTRRAIEGLCSAGSMRPLCASASGRRCPEQADSNGCTMSRHNRVNRLPHLATFESCIVAFLIRRRKKVRPWTRRYAR
jgi:hypothetical protein